MPARSWIVLSAVAIAAPALGQAPADGPPPQDSPPAEPAPKPARTWLDASHDELEQLLAELALRIDDFLGEERRLEMERPGSALRWRNEVRSGQDRALAFRSTVRASLDLPGTARWLSQAQLVIAGETRADPSGAPAEDPMSPALSPTLAAEQASLEARLHLLQRAATRIDAGAGVRFRFPPQPYLRVRLRHRQPLIGPLTLRATPSVFWQTRDGFGASAGLDLDLPLDAHALLRWNNQATLSEITRGVEWASEVSAAREVVAWRAVAALGAGAGGHGRSALVVDHERVFARVRRDVWRRWLFAELEPEMSWPLDPAGRRRRVVAATLRLEVHFDGRRGE